MFHSDGRTDEIKKDNLNYSHGTYQHIGLLVPGTLSIWYVRCSRYVSWYVCTYWRVVVEARRTVNTAEE